MVDEGIDDLASVPVIAAFFSRLANFAV